MDTRLFGKKGTSNLCLRLKLRAVAKFDICYKQDITCAHRHSNIFIIIPRLFDNLVFNAFIAPEQSLMIDTKFFVRIKIRITCNYLIYKITTTFNNTRRKMFKNLFMEYKVYLRSKLYFTELNFISWK